MHVKLSSDQCVVTDSLFDLYLTYANNQEKKKNNWKFYLNMKTQVEDNFH